MSIAESRQGWWQASDGNWYPPELHPNAAPTLPPPPAAPAPTVPNQAHYSGFVATPPTAKKPKKRKWVRVWAIALRRAVRVGPDRHSHRSAGPVDRPTQWRRIWICFHLLGGPTQRRRQRTAVQLKPGGRDRRRWQQRRGHDRVLRELDRGLDEGLLHEWRSPMSFKRPRTPRFRRRSPRSSCVVGVAIVTIHPGTGRPDA